MTYASRPAGRFIEGDLRIGQVLSRAWSVFSGNFLKFSVITGIASLPSLLLPQPSVGNAGNQLANWPVYLFAFFLIIALSMLSQAAVFYGAFQDMRQRPVSVADGLKVGLERFLPLLGVAGVIFLAFFVLVMVAAIVIAVPATVFAVPGLAYASALVVIPAVMLFLMWSMGTPVCVVERLGPFRSLGRSRELTKGHRWKILGLLLVTMIPGLIIGAVVGAVLGAILVFGSGGGLGAPAIQVISLIWKAIWSAFFSIVIAVTYHDLRVAKEGVDTDQIAAVFE
jgi:hypothetical protein